jgi:ribonuclease Z
MSQEKQSDAPEPSVANVTTMTRKLGNFTIEGYSRAAVQSCWRIHEMKIGFDVGAHPWDFMSVPKIFISHTHLDHIAALPVHIARRRMMKMEKPTIYLPESAVAAVESLLKVFARLDRGRLPCELIGMRPDEEITINRELVLTTSATRHTVPSLGFVVWERRNKLKPEYAALEGHQIRDLKLAGVEITKESRIPLIAYTGDTTPEGIDDCPAMYEAETLITEMTFLDPRHRKEKIHKHGHTHIDDIVARQSKFKNKHIICGHFSVRYSDRQIHNWIKKSFPDLLGGRLIPWI